MPSEDADFDRAGVIETIYREMRAIDTKDWPALRECFTDEIELDMRGAPFGPNKPIRLAAGKWVKAVKGSMDRFTVTQHSSSNEIVEFSGQQAICRSYMLARHVYSQPGGSPLVYELWERFTHKLVKAVDGWRISAFKADVC
ncbi:MAG: nuclear transport factor 2 family protein [Candidatus Binataceae bacterium]